MRGRGMEERELEVWCKWRGLWARGEREEMVGEKEEVRRS